MAYTVLTLADLCVRLEAKRDGILQWTPEEERLAINEALRTWNLLTGRWRTTLTLPTVIGGVEYSLVSTLIYGARVTVNGLPLTITSTTELDLMRPTWRAEAVSAGGDVPTVPTLWVPVSLQKIAIWPQLSTIITNGLSIEGVAATPVLQQDGDTIDLGQELLDTLLNFCLHLLSFKLGGATWQQTMPFYRSFLQAAAEENGILKSHQKFRRWAGLNRRIDLQTSKGESNQLMSISQASGLQ